MKSLAESIVSAPAVYNAEAAAQFIESLDGGFAALPEPARALLKGVAGASPYLRRLALGRKDGLAAMFAAPPHETLKDILARAESVAEADGMDAQMKALREAKQDAALLIALADIGGAWSVMETTEALSRFADAALKGALACAIARSPLETSLGLVFFAMGKHGAYELNYSSDIDLVVLFDPSRMGHEDRHEAQKHAVAVTRDVVNMMQMQTADGYVFRTDLRLRPDPGVTALAISVTSAESYYEAFGQNWERMAFIKARPAAGDIALGENFLKTLRPFIWRKFFDYAAIEDVHAVKRQMHSAKGGGDIAFEGHDVKLGRGGIREIEFYAQTQQLILGGKTPALRMRATLDALEALAEAEAITEAARDELSEAYRYLRHVEHRLQMVNDEQTHRIPREAEDIKRVALFAGAENAEAFRKKLLATLERVSAHYDGLFEADETPESRLGPLVFTGVELHPATLETLEKLGFKRAPDVSAAIMRWHKGTLRATRTERARTLLTKLVPPLLEALSKAGDPDEAFFAFEDFLARLPAGVQVFSLLLNNLDVFDTLIRIMTISPYLGRQFSKHLNLVERLLDNRWSEPPPLPESYEHACKTVVEAAPDYEAALNAARRWAGEQNFQITAQLAVGILSPEDASRHFTAIADASIRALLAAALAEMEAQHGAVDGDFVTVGLGRLGAGEMTATSDIDLMFIYDAPQDAQSDGARPLGAVDYFTRLVRRAVTALSAATEEGALYEVDMQLRPSGKAGPAAVSLAAFRRYYAEEAWTWEAMAMVKARVIGPAGKLADAVSAEIDAIVARARDPETLPGDVAAMRARLDEAKPGAGPWDVKNIVGGLTDIAFICQYLALRAGAKGRAPRSVAKALVWFAKEGELAQEEAETLISAHRLFEAVLQVSRAATGGVFTPEKAGEALCVRMASVCGEQTIDAAERNLLRHEAQTAALFTKIVGERRARQK
ncbi:bifunctional [glutamine synthetase] adenylyltransferase/[glutamine synthetase]-adenylyl-L-tyrosine phosphorylase [Hyphococcus luteus]|uniref:Bifunctional [glutamate--ammonia ligase]-adenylyl-L-tyrosine phosphorylase/[glutamate--ammonia-ligase] adenylyltransferase n=1 Tax=Hyphococcus luteus TaxID=2058213 RepID=A0A2S7K451_9PROT|nr:bifunctional [glutamine synthetase] adenylyltransferase/[glutamine synthetase]-adenylyl-L-tyrosine phosphorylase [Marinicaulis flavus]PQA87261.1 bifunctional [glutamate--ammonia ligase]-adenylyl-L-tyrosine phosphorylase/[glutamate--ammonia-ligase] adenylyltransferase [Marinicaulis flavus]